MNLLLEELDGDDHTFVDDDFEMDGDPEEDARTECDTLVVCDKEFWWTCHPKYGDELVETAPVSYDELREAFGIAKAVAS